MKDARHRVAITGLGAFSCVGNTKDGLWNGALGQGGPGVRTIDRFDPTAFTCKIAGQVDDFVATDHMDAQKAKRLDRFAQFSLASARMALDDSGLDLSRIDSDRVGIYVGSALGGIAFAEEQHGLYVQKGLRAVRPTLAISVFGGASSCNIAMEFGTHGPNIANANSCASGAIAVGEAARLIARGETTTMLAGAVECPLSPLAFGAFALIRAMSTRNDDPASASRPFDAQRDGFVMAEGAGMLVLEQWEQAQARGAHIYAELLGYATTNDAFSMTSPRTDVVQSLRCMHKALDDAACAPGDLGYVNAHGSSTPLNDTYESLAISRLLQGARVPVSSTKGAHAHALGASGAMELVLCAQVFERKCLPPTLNLTVPADDCRCIELFGEAREAGVDRVLSNSFGFGGINACVVLGRA